MPCFMARLGFQPKCRPRVFHIRLTGVAITTSYAEYHLIQVANAKHLSKTLDEIIDKALGQNTAAVATVKL